VVKSWTLGPNHCEYMKLNNGKRKKGTSSQFSPRSGVRHQSVELDASSHRTVRLRGARSRWADSLDAKGEVPRLIATELAEVRSGELAVEQAVELSVLWGDLAVGHLERIRLRGVGI
jgi:hypothetical protein